MVQRLNIVFMTTGERAPYAILHLEAGINSCDAGMKVLKSIAELAIRFDKSGSSSVEQFAVALCAEVPKLVESSALIPATSQWPSDLTVNVQEEDDDILLSFSGDPPRYGRFCGTGKDLSSLLRHIENSGGG